MTTPRSAERVTAQAWTAAVLLALLLGACCLGLAATLVRSFEDSPPRSRVQPTGAIPDSGVGLGLRASGTYRVTALALLSAQVKPGEYAVSAVGGACRWELHSGILDARTGEIKPYSGARIQVQPLDEWLILDGHCFWAEALD